MRAFTLLGLESSCDDTAAAVVRGVPGDAQVLSSVVMGQSSLHADFGGVVPEIAARAHAERLDVVVRQALADALVAADAENLVVPCEWRCPPGPPNPTAGRPPPWRCPMV